MSLEKYKYKCLVFPRISFPAPHVHPKYISEYSITTNPKKLSSFGVLDRMFFGHDVVFLHPIEVVESLDLKVMSPSKSGEFIVIDIDRETEEYIRKLFVAIPLPVVFVSDRLTVNSLSDIKFSRGGKYIYGRLGREVERISYSDLVGRSKLIWQQVDGLRKESIGVYFGQFLFTYYVRLPMYTYGLALIEEGGWVTTLSPEILYYIYLGDVLKFRVFSFHDVDIPVVVVRRLQLSLSNDGWNLGDFLTLYNYYLYDYNVDFDAENLIHLEEVKRDEVQ